MSARDGICVCCADAGGVAVGVASCSLHAMPSSTFSVRVGGVVAVFAATAPQNYIRRCSPAARHDDAGARKQRPD